MKHKMDRPSLVIHIAIIVWIALWNALALALHHHLEGLPFRGWAFFISVTFYYFMEEPNWKKKMASTFFGGTVGILFTLFLVLVDVWLEGMGIGHTTAVMIPLCVVLIVLIMGKPYCPVLFNSIGFAYFVITTMPGVVDTIVEDTIPYIVSIGLGCIILCGGCQLMTKLIADYYTKKAAKAAK